MKTIITSYDVKELFNDIFNEPNKLKASKMKVDINENGQTRQIPMVDYLNVEFYSFRNDIKNSDIIFTENGFEFYNLNAWLISLNKTLNCSYALVEISDSTITTSQDIDSGNVTSNITFIIQEDKIQALELYLSILRQKYAGLELEYVNQNGDTLSTYLSIGALSYDNEPENTCLGQTIVASCQLEWSYIAQSLNYNMEKVSVSFDDTTYTPFPFTNLEKSIMFTGKANTKANMPNLTGIINQNATLSFSFTFWLMKDNAFMKALNDKMMLECCDSYVSDLTTPTFTDNSVREINIPIYVIITDTFNNKKYKYKMVITKFSTSVTNADFTVGHLDLATYAK